MVGRRVKESRILRLLLAIAIVLTGFGFIKVQAAATDANRMNVVFVLDQSGSMKQTDANLLRYEAVDLFLGMSAENGNYMGAVVFDDNIVLQEDIKQVDGKEAKTLLSQHVRDANSNGDTDIGKAIELATKMLSEQGNPSLESAIILLSDGNTDLPKDTSGAALAASRESKQKAIDLARQEGYKIHSICLNANGKASVSELQDISDATGGVCVEVKNAEDLKTVFTQFYNIIYSAETITLVDTNLDANGELSVPFQIPLLGVEEANIIINTLNEGTSYKLFNPSGIAYTDDELDQITVKAKTFAIIKIPNPEAGDWELKVTGIPGDQIKVDMVYNVNLMLRLDTSAATGSASIGDTVSFTGTIQSQSGDITAAEVYQKYPITLRITNTSTGNTEETQMNAGSGFGSGSWTVGEAGEYDAQAFCQVEKVSLESGIVHISAGNTAPVVKENPVHIDVFVTPLTPPDYEYDLSQVVTDAEDPTLSYRIDDAGTSMDPAHFTLNDSQLVIKIKECNDGDIISVYASDSVGAEVQFNVKVSKRSLLLIILPIILGILALIAVIILLLKLKGKPPIPGKIYMVPYDSGGMGDSVTEDGTRGKMVLLRYIDHPGDVKMNLSKTYLISSGKESFIYLCSSEGLYVEGDANGKKQKKISLYANNELNVSTDPEFENGIRITYLNDDL